MPDTNPDRNLVDEEEQRVEHLMRKYSIPRKEARRLLEGSR